MSKMDALIANLTLPSVMQEFAYSGLIILTAFVICFILRRHLIPFLSRSLRKLPTPHAAEVLYGARKPMTNLMFLIGVEIAVLPVLPYFYVLDTRPVHTFFRVLYILVIAQLCCCLAETVPFFGHWHDKNAQSIQKLIRGIIKVVVLCCAAVIVLGELGYNVNGLITGLGLGGLTLSLAAQSTVSNVFAGTLLLTERPFEVGDWIICAGTEGTVEEISLRATKIRTFSNTLVVLPNTTICAEPINNYTRMKMRLKQFTLSLALDTPQEKVETLIERLTEIIAADPDVISERVQVHLFGFGASSIDIRVVYYTSTTVYAEWLAIGQRLHFKLLALMRELDVHFARTLHDVQLSSANDRQTGPQ